MFGHWSVIVTTCRLSSPVVDYISIGMRIQLAICAN